MFILANVTEVVMTQDKEKSHQVDNIPLTLKGVLKFYYYFRQARPYVENVHYVKTIVRLPWNDINSFPFSSENLFTCIIIQSVSKKQCNILNNIVISMLCSLF